MALTGDGDFLPYELVIRDGDFKPVVGVRNFISGIVQLKLNDASSWTIIADGDSPIMPYIPTDTEPDYRTGILMTHPNYGILFSGPITQVKSVEDETTPIGTPSTGGGRYEISGMGDTGLLATRRVYPDPAGISDNAFSQESDDVIGTAEELMHYYVDVNATSEDTTFASDLDRLIPGLTRASLHSPPLNTPMGVPQEFEVHGKLETLLELCQRIAWTADPKLIFYVLQNSARALKFVVDVPTDRTAEGHAPGTTPAIFSVHTRTARRLERTTSAATGTWVIVGGQGEAASQMFTEGPIGPPAPGVPRIETYVTDPTATTPDDLDLATLPALEAGRSLTAVTLVPAETGGLIYGRDYRLGDKVTVRVGGASYTMLVTDVRFVFDASGVSVLPTLSTRGASRDLARGNGDVRRLSERISLMERTMTTFPVAADADTNYRIQMKHGINSTGSGLFAADDIATVGMAVDAPSGQTANLQEWKVDGTVVASVAADGSFSSTATPTATPSARIYASSPQATVSGSPLWLEFNSVRWDNASLSDTGASSPGNRRLTLGAVGRWTIGAAVYLEEDSTGYREVALVINGGTFIADQRHAAPGGTFWTATIETEWMTTVDTDYVEVIVAQNSGNPLNVGAADAFCCEFWASYEGPV